MSRERFEAAVLEAINSIPAAFQPYVQDIEFIVAERSTEGLLGLYEGAGASAESLLPPRVTIFQEAHERGAGNWPELVAEVRRTVLHEVGHHFEMEEDELPY
ncbi:MAG: metallopeptidase family protein [Candidatus Dormibacteraeota bacterium]|nr:metallopeptidase family protein [Candidatus Dormibacteraeota bacterium]